MHSADSPENMADQTADKSSEDLLNQPKEYLDNPTYKGSAASILERLADAPRTTENIASGSADITNG